MYLTSDNTNNVPRQLRALKMSVIYHRNIFQFTPVKLPKHANN